jgi:UDP-glucose 4-epimerase
MKAIVTGGNGFIGSHLVDRLVNEGWEVSVIDNLSAECNDDFYFNDGATNHQVDICDYERMLPIFEGANVVFHLAAESRIQPAIINPARAAEVNVLGTCNVLQAARTHNVDRIVYSSTSAGYGLVNTPPLVETMPKDCLNPYSVTKCAGEDLCVMYNRLFGLNTVTLRYFNVYGERSPTKGQYAPVLGLFYVQKAAGKPLTLVGDGLQRRDFTHVADVVEANVLAASTDNTAAMGEIFNVGTGTNHSILEVAQLISDDLTYLPPRPGEARITLADNQKIRTMLGWEPKVRLEDWIDSQEQNT